ncbi:hypothetical protein C4D60_Mb11t21690 [Musa balbisiana]|uniref:Uncharacterized protein n=1 Tax=Musa balbisiana TaxID=52838 RepID=A0A4S8J5T6_MUSBA|nr:hypothetical protein C4D60_Mb11t21690 [Musa balbisiana]
MIAAHLIMMMMNNGLICWQLIFTARELLRTAFPSSSVLPAFVLLRAQTTGKRVGIKALLVSSCSMDLPLVRPPEPVCVIPLHLLLELPPAYSTRIQLIHQLH